MSKERELLKECRLILDTPFNGSTGTNLRNRITELLAQPEQTGQPVRYEYSWRLDSDNGWLAWCSCSKDDYLAYQIPDMFENIHYRTRKLYTSPPKREPLSDLQVWAVNSEPLFEDGVRFAERHHSIGGDEK